MPMSPERKAGIIFAVAVVAILGLIGLMLGTSRARGFEYTVLFRDGKGLRKGDRVQMNGVDIGLVRAVELDRDGASIRVDLEIDREHHVKIQTNSTAYIGDPTFPNVSGQKIVEIVNSARPSPPLPAKSVVMGRESLAELKAWQFSEQVGTWSEQLRGMVKDLSDAARSGFQRGREALPRRPDSGDPGEWEHQENPPAPDGGNSIASTPEDETSYGPEIAAAPPSETDHAAARFHTDQPGMAGAADLLQQFKGSEEYQALADRTIDILRRLSDRGMTSALSQIILDWKELRKELEPAIAVLKDAGKLAMADQLERMMRAVEEMIRLRQQQLEEEGGDGYYQPVEPRPDVLEI